MRARSVAFGAFMLIELVGCVPAHYVDGVRFVAEQHGARSADSLAVAGRGYLRFDLPLQSDLDDVLAGDRLETMQLEGMQVIEAANALAIRTTNNEIDRLPPAGLGQLVRRYGFTNAPADTEQRREFLKKKYQSRSQELAKRDIAKLDGARSVGSARRLLTGIRSGIEPPAGDRGKLSRVLIAAPLFLPAAIGAEIADAEAAERDVTFDFERVVVYEPPVDAGPPNAAALASADLESLARWYAPVFVQQVLADASYEPTSDRIGRVALGGESDNIRVSIETADPVVYWTCAQAKVGKRRYDQLIYVAWYPRRPALVANDPQAGDIDGVVVRITLDSSRRPAIYEFVRSCGCFHTLWVAEFVEAAARAEFGKPAGSQQFAVQRAGASRDLFMPALVADDGSRPHRPEAFVTAGDHLLVGIHPQRDESPSYVVEETLPYTLTPYENLTRLPLGDGIASMFGNDGLVHNTGRAEGWLLAPTGMLSAGQPRQIGTMKIRMDAYDYDDPRLLDRNLRLPQKF